MRDRLYMKVLVIIRRTLLYLFDKHRKQGRPLLSAVSSTLRLHWDWTQ